VQVRSVAVDPSGQWLASGSADGTVRVWEVRSGRCCHVEGLGAPVHCVAWCPAATAGLLSAAVGNRVALFWAGACPRAPPGADCKRRFEKELFLGRLEGALVWVYWTGCLCGGSCDARPLSAGMVPRWQGKHAWTPANPRAPRFRRMVGRRASVGSIQMLRWFAPRRAIPRLTITELGPILYFQVEVMRAVSASGCKQRLVMAQRCGVRVCRRRQRGVGGGRG
jgi:WD domain, G-beta repeat